MNDSKTKKGGGGDNWKRKRKGSEMAVDMLVVKETMCIVKREIIRSQILKRG